jgi:hypothetical protein
MATNKEPKFLTPEATLMFPSLFEPRAFEEGGKETYQCILVFPKGADISAVTNAINSCAKSLRNPSGARNPLRDGNEKVDEWGELFRDAKYIRISSYFQPIVVDGAKREILDKNQVYSGAIARAVCRCFSYEGKMGKGVSIGFDALQIVRDGERLGGGAASVALFDSVGGDAGTPAEDPFA